MARQLFGVLVLLFAALGVHGAPSDVDFDDSDERIVGGVNAVPNQRPFQISLRDATSNGHFCGGAIVTDRWVVTVAHCVVGRTPTSFNIMAGSIYLNTGNTMYFVQKSIPHQSYNSMTGENDIAMLKTTTVMAILLPNIKVVPVFFAPVPDNVTIVASGWGLTSFPGSVPNILQVLSSRSLNNGVCKTTLAPTGLQVFVSHLCTFTKAGQGLCYGDSGSPLTYNNHLVALVSRGIPCAKGYPDVSTGILHHIIWMIITIIFN